MYLYFIHDIRRNLCNDAIANYEFEPAVIDNTNIICRIELPYAWIVLDNLPRWVLAKICTIRTTQSKIFCLPAYLSLYFQHQSFPVKSMPITLKLVGPRSQIGCNFVNLRPSQLKLASILFFLQGCECSQNLLCPVKWW